MAAIEKTKIFIPQVENMAVVTKGKRSAKKRNDGLMVDIQWPGMALSRATKAILNPPSRTTCARHAYEILVRSNFSPRARQQYLKALKEGD